MSIYFFKELKFKNILLIFLVLCFIFLFDLKYEYFQFRYFILILLIPCIFYIFSDIKNKNYNFLASFLFLNLFILFHSGLNLFLEKEQYSNYYLYSIFYLIFIFTISYYFRKFINKNIYFITKFFVIIFLISSLLSLISFVPDAPYFCGGIPDIFNLIDTGTPLNKYYRLSFREFIFLENSHFGMIAPSIILLGTYKIFSAKRNYFDKTIFLFFFLLCLIKSSTTFFLGLLISSIFLFLFNFRNFSKSIKISFSILIIFSSLILIFNDECRTRFGPYKSNIQDNLSEQANLNPQKDSLIY